MKKLLALLGLALAFVASLPAQETAPTPAPLRTPEQIDQLLGPIALYPDALIALILPASTASADIVLASRYFQGGGDPGVVDSQPWDDSVRDLAHYPEIVKWMDQNLAWTKQLGDAFVAQPVDVMQSVQRLRAAARAAGTLTDTPQQQVVVEDDAISIVPAQPDVIYVPYYDPDVVYVMRPGYYGEPYLTFGVGFPVGAWLSFDLDWGHRRIWYVSREDRERYWREHGDWRHPVFPGRPGYVRDPDRHPWRPVPDYTRSPQADSRRLRAEVVRPTPLPSAPPRPPVRRQDAPPTRPDNRDRPVQADERARQLNVPPNRTAVTAAPATAPNAPVAQPQTPPPARRADVQRERNDDRQPDQRGREFQGNPANRPPAPVPAQVERTVPAPRQTPPGPPPPSQVRPQQPPPPPPANRSAPSSEDDKKRTDKVQN
jgi:hypothetical protein